MQGVDLERTRVFDTRAPRAPKSIRQHWQKLFELKGVRLGSDEETGYGLSRGFWGSPVGQHFTAPVVAGDAVYFTVSVGDGYVLALDKETGEVRWKFAQPRALNSPSVISDGVIYLLRSDGFVYALR